MTYLTVITAFLAVYLRDMIGGDPLLSPGWAAAASIGSIGAIALVCWGTVGLLGRIVDRTGRMNAIRGAEAMVAASRFGAMGAYATAVLFLGWADAVRNVTGDVVLLDELLITLPLLLSYVLGWWAFEPIERRMRDAVLLRRLNDGSPVYQPWSRARFVWSNVRHQLLLVLIPLSLMGGWSEAVERYSGRVLGVHGDALMLAHTGLQLVGVAAVFTLMPLVLRMIWDAVPLAQGPLSERLLAVCRRNDVRVRGLLVWRTNGMIVNGAVMGLIRPLRYILLTDALLDHLNGDQLEAVTSHEVAHVKRRHMLWLAAVMLACLMLVGSVAGIGAELLVPGASGEVVVGVIAALCSLAAAIGVFGLVSRRFEWQADAFAACDLSRAAGSDRITPEAASAMSASLRAVADLNHVPLWKSSWRHGSIGLRIRRLSSIVGMPISKLRIDAQVRAIKWATGASFGLAVAASIIQVILEMRLAR